MTHSTNLGDLHSEAAQYPAAVPGNPVLTAKNAPTPLIPIPVIKEGAGVAPRPRTTNDQG